VKWKIYIFFLLLFSCLYSSDENSNFYSDINLGYLYNSNVNAKPDKDTLLNCYHSFIPSRKDIKISDHALYYDFLLFNIHKKSSYTKFKNSINIKITDYIKLDEYDYEEITLKSAIYTQKDKMVFSIPFILKRTKEGHKYEYSTFHAALTPLIGYSYSSFFTSIKLFFQKNHYHDFDEGDNNSFSLSTKYFINKNSNVTVKGYNGSITDGFETDNKNYKGVIISYYTKLFKNLKLYMDSSMHYTYYDAYKKMFRSKIQKRKDKSSITNFDISYHFKNSSLIVKLFFSHLKNKSNLKIYNYKRDKIIITLSRYF